MSERITSKLVEQDDTDGAAHGVPDTGDAARDPRRLGVATQERVRRAVHERVFGAPRDPVRIGRYTVLKRLGQGGMGVVYAAYDTELDRKVALKLLHFEHADEAQAPRLVREAKALAKLSHPSIVAVHEVGEQDGHVFVAMEFVEGDTLRAYVAQRTLDWREIVGLYVQAGRGLAAAHAVGLVHRDFKPDNALVSLGRHGDHASARVRVLDFGLARSLGDREHPRDVGSRGAREHAIALTQTGALLGTPAYMAPEQYVGAAVDAHADQFAFCVSLWEALYRQRPFDDTSSASVAAAILSGRRRAAPIDVKLPDALHRVLERGLELRPVDRFSSMVELVDTLEDLLAASRRGRVGLAIGAAGLALVLGAWVWAGRERDHSSRAVALADEAAVEHARAEQALAALEEREQAVLLAEAEILLERDPTSAMAKLAQLDPTAPQWGTLARVLAADARDRGVARHVLALPPGREAKRWWGQPGRWVVTGEVAKDGETLVDLDHGTVIPLHGERPPSPALAPSREVEAAALAPDGSRRVVYDGTRLFVQGGRRDVVLARGLQLRSLDVSRDFGTIAWGSSVGGDAEDLRVADAGGRVLRTIAVDGLARDDVDLDARGERVAVRRRGGGLDVFDVAGTRVRHLATDDEVRLVRWSDDGAWLLAADEGAAIHVWRLADGGLRTVHAGVDVVDFALDAEADVLRVLGRDQLREYEGVLPAMRRTIPGDDVEAFATDPAARTIVTLHAGNRSVLRMHRDDAPRLDFDTDHPVVAIAVSPDGELVAGAGADTISVWRRNGRLFARARNPDGTGHIEFDPQGHRLAWIGHSGTVVLWRPGSGTPRMFEPSRLGVYALAFVPGSERVGVVGWDHMGPLFYMLDPQRGVVGSIPVRVADDVQPRAVAFSSRGALAFAAVGQGVYVVDQRGAAPRRLGGREVAEASLSFSQGGGQLAALGGRSGATVWDVDTGASYRPALAGLRPRGGVGTVGGEGPFALVADRVVTQAVLGLGGSAADVRAWVLAATDLHVGSEALADAVAQSNPAASKMSRSIAE